MYMWSFGSREYADKTIDVTLCSRNTTTGEKEICIFAQKKGRNTNQPNKKQKTQNMCLYLNQQSKFFTKISKMRNNFKKIIKKTQKFVNTKLNRERKAKGVPRLLRILGKVYFFYLCHSITVV